MALAVEFALEWVGSLVTNHDAFCRCGREVDVGSNLSVNLVVANVYLGSKPLELCGRANGVYTVYRLHEVRVGFATYRAEAVNESVCIAYARWLVGIFVGAVLACAVAVEVALLVDDAVCAEWHRAWVDVAGKVLAPQYLAGREAAVELIGELTRSYSGNVELLELSAD